MHGTVTAILQAKQQKCRVNSMHCTSWCLKGGRKVATPPFIYFRYITAYSQLTRPSPFTYCMWSVEVSGSLILPVFVPTHCLTLLHTRGCWINRREDWWHCCPQWTGWRDWGRSHSQDVQTDSGTEWDALGHSPRSYCMHTQTHTYTNTCTHTYIQHKHMHTHTHYHIHTGTHAHTYTHAYKVWVMGAGQMNCWVVQCRSGRSA